MKKLLILFLFFNFSVKSQVCTTMVAYDYIETYNWTGLWWVGTTSNYYTNASVSPTVSAAIYGLGSGTSAIEGDWYVMPNITGLNPSYTYIFQFRLASYRFTNPTATTAGVDNADFVEVQLSTDGEITYFAEMRIRGNGNAYWDYNTNATASKTANGVTTIYTPAAGGNRTTTGDGFSVIKLQLPAGVTQCAVDLYCRVNSAGEEWWIDNVELIQIAPCVPLPIELVSFEGTNNKEYNHLTWFTATELNNSHFVIERSLNALDWEGIAIVQGGGTSNTPIYYDYNDYTYNKESINYYRLKQVDFSSEFKYSQIISIINPQIKKKVLVKTITIDGREVSESYKGMVIELYSDGSVKRLIRE